MSLFQPGENCWRRVHADRCAFLIDADAYFNAFAAAASLAQRSIIIVGWDFNGQVALRRGGDESGDVPSQLGDFLNYLVAKRRRLNIYILEWDFAAIYALEREIFPLYRTDWRAHRRVHFELDDHHPLGASQHQKIVVIDNAIAFSGGLDFGPGRWDTSRHTPDDPRRSDWRGGRYPPFHDVQVAVDGEAARALGALARERWRKATGRELNAPESNSSSVWPADLKPDAEDLGIAIARTVAAYGGEAEVREVERSYIDSIQRARSLIYIENQYLTSASIGAAIEERLADADCPEMVLVIRRECSGWLESNVMGTLRARLLQRLCKADRFGRLHVYSPTSGGESVNIHSKVMIVDDDTARIGSSNLSNRSMGLDSECDVILEAAGSDSSARAIAHLRLRLLSEHLGTTVDSLARAVDTAGSLAAAIEALRGNSQTLEPMPADCDEIDWIDIVPSARQLADPEKPIDADTLADMFLPEVDDASGRGAWVYVVLVLSALASLAAAWRWSPLAELLDAERIAAWAQQSRASSLAPVLLAASFVPAGLLLVPVTLLITACGIALRPGPALAAAIIGSLSSAAVTYAIGRSVSRRNVRRLAGKRLNRITERLRKGTGVLPMAVFRLFPIAPFGVVNAVAGAVGISFRNYIIGTALGMLPGIVTIVFLAEGAQAALFQPSASTLSMVGGGAAVVLSAALLLYRKTRRSQPCTK